MTPAEILAIQTELRRIADSLDESPPQAGIVVIESAVIVDEDTALKLAIEITPYD